MSRQLAKQIDALLDDWREDADMTTAEYTLVQIQTIIDKKLGRKERSSFYDIED